MSRVNELLREIIAEEVGELKDPAIGFVTITGVDTAPDLRTAIVFYTAMGDEDVRADCAEALHRASARVQGRLAPQIRLKYTPTLEFRVDFAVEHGLQMEETLRQLRERRRE